MNVDELVSLLRLERNDAERLHRSRRYLREHPDHNGALLARALEKIDHEDLAGDRARYQYETTLGDDGHLGGEAWSRCRHTCRKKHGREVDGQERGYTAGMPTGNWLAGDEGEGAAEVAVQSLPQWRELGPMHVGGRTRALVVDRHDPGRLFAGGMGGGVWRSDDAGSSWRPTDDFMANLVVGSLVMHPEDSEVLFAGTGESFAGEGVRGDGIFRTRDGGDSWHQLPFTRTHEFYYINALAMSVDGTIVLAGTNEGIFWSDDEGESWQHVHPGLRISHIATDPSHRDNAVAATRDGKVLFSENTGVDWSDATIPSEGKGRIHVAYAAGNSDFVYASVAAKRREGGVSEVWRSTNGGKNFELRDGCDARGEPANCLGRQGHHDNVVWAGDPDDTDLVLVGGIDLWRSLDGGDTLEPISDWTNEASIHADHHVIVAAADYCPESNRRVYFGNDGGVYRADDVLTVGGGEELADGWIELNTRYAVTQFFSVDAHEETGIIFGGTLDNGTFRFAPGSVGLGPESDGWNKVWRGDGGYVASDPRDPGRWYGEYANLWIFRNTTGDTSGYPNDYICGRYHQETWGWKPPFLTIPDARSYKAQFVAPFALDQHNPERLLAGGQSLWLTENASEENPAEPIEGGPEWREVKEPLDATEIHSGRTPQISALALGGSGSELVLVGYTNGEIHLCTNGIERDLQWERIDHLGPDGGIRATRHCTSLAIHPRDHNVLYAGFGGYQANNLWRSPDRGESWQRIGYPPDGNWDHSLEQFALPETPIRAITFHPDVDSWIYVATDTGVYASEDWGDTWRANSLGPANVACRDFAWIGTRLVCATFGRGMWEIDLPPGD